MAGSIFGALGSFFGFGSKPATTPTTKPSGTDGEAAPGGFIPSTERSSDLRGTELWKTYQNTLHQTMVVAAAVRNYLALTYSTSWSAEPNPLGGKTAQKAADLVESGLLNATMPRPWRSCVKKQAFYHFGGFAIHEWTIKRQAKGQVVFAELGHRPQSTIWRWDKVTEQSPLLGVEQLTVWGHTYYMPRSRIWYTVDDTLTDSPAGMGVLRHVVGEAQAVQLLERWEGFAYEQDLRGIPVGWAPIKKLRDQAKTDNKDAQKFIDSNTEFLTNFLDNHRKGNKNDKALFFDSSVYTSSEQVGSVPSPNKHWGIDLLKGDSGPLAEMNSTIQRRLWQIASVLNAEWLLVGMTNGTHALHENKTALFAKAINATLDQIADTATADLARPLVAMNGLDPDTCTPRLRVKPVATAAILDMTKALLDMAQAGSPVMPGGEDAIDDLFEMMGLPKMKRPSLDLNVQRPALLPREPIQEETTGLPREPQFLGKPAADDRPAPANTAKPLGPDKEQA